MTGASQGRVAMVTGGTGALGRAVVRRLAQAGHTVHLPWVAEREVAGLERALAELRPMVHLHQCDVTVESQVLKLFGTIAAAGETIQILANVVGGFTGGTIEETSREAWDRMFAVNATSAFLCSRAAVPGMKSARHGRIVNVSSAPATSRGAANLSAYSAAKAAVLNLSESLAKELAPWRITVNAIVPSVINTPANRAVNPAADRSTWLAPEEIANVIGYLVSDEAAIVTGSALILSKG